MSLPRPVDWAIVVLVRLVRVSASFRVSMEKDRFFLASSNTAGRVHARTYWTKMRLVVENELW